MATKLVGQYFFVIIGISCLFGCASEPDQNCNVRIVAEGVHDEFLRVYFESDSQKPIFVYLEARNDGSGLNLFFKKGNQVGAGLKQVPINSNSNQTWIDIEWKEFDRTEIQLWVNGSENLGAWQLSNENKRNQGNK